MVKRLIENGIGPDEEAEEGGEDGDDDELVDPDAEAEKPSTSKSAPPPAVSFSAFCAAVDVDLQTQPSTSAASTAPQDTAASIMTPEEQARRARAERFGIPLNSNPSTSSRTNGSSKPSQPPAVASAPVAASKPQASTSTPAPSSKNIDQAPLGITDEVLAKRAAKFGLPEKTTPTAPPPIPVATSGKEVDLSPEVAEKMAEEEEKKRKRAEKFGLLPGNEDPVRASFFVVCLKLTNEDAKKTKV